MPAASAILMVSLGLVVTRGAETGARLEGTVQDENSSWVVAAEVKLLTTGTEETIAETQTGRSGTFVLSGVPPGSYDLQIRSLGFYRVKVRGITLAAGEPRSLPAITIEVASTGCLSWYPLWQQFLDTRASPGAELVSVVLDEGHDGPLKDVTVTLTGSGQTRTEQTDAKGVFQFGGLAAGAYQIAVLRQGYWDWSYSWVTVRSGFRYTYPAVRLKKCPGNGCDPALRRPAVVCD